MQVFKFGGASVKDADAVKNLVQIVSNYPSTPLLIVVSAMGKMTNKLEDLAKAYLNGEDKSQAIFDEIKTFHFDILNQLFHQKQHQIYNDVANTFVEIEWILEEEINDEKNYIYDQIVSIGELVSTKIIAAYLIENYTAPR
jgi:aspartate kinase